MSFSFPPPPAPRTLKRWIILALVVLALALAGSFAFRMFMMTKIGGGMGGGKDFAVAVYTSVPRAEKATRVIDAVGTLRADQFIHVAPEVAGRIADIPAREGEGVKKGDVLVILDKDIATADQAGAEATLASARSTYERARSLAARSFGTQQAKDDALAALKRAEAQLASAQARSGKTVLTAPFDGVLGLREESVGAYVNAGTSIITLSSIDPMMVDFRVPELQSAAIRTGQTAQVTVDALPGRLFEAMVVAVDPQLDDAGRSLGVRARIVNEDGALRAGMFAHVALHYGEPVDVLVVPERAVYLKGNELFVYRAARGVAEEVKITLGERRVGEVEISSGITATDDVVTDGQIKLRPGAKLLLLSKPNIPAEEKGESKKE